MPLFYAIGKRKKLRFLHCAPVWEGAQLFTALHNLGQALFQHRLFSSLCLVCPPPRPAQTAPGGGDISYPASLRDFIK